MRILSLFGTRPEAIKMAPVVKILDEAGSIESRVCVTAQHRELLDQVLEAFEIEADLDLDLMRENQDLTELTGRLLGGVREALEKLDPDLVLAHGDTTTTFAVSLAAFYKRIPVGHVEAGLRTRNKYAPFPEEINRQLTSRLADLHFAPTEKARENLLAESTPSDSIFVTGNPAIDALLWMRDRIRSGKVKPEFPVEALRGPGRLALITAHRRESFGEPFERICLAIRDLAKRFAEDVFVYPVHLNPNIRGPAEKHLAGLANVHLVSPLPYADFVALLEASHIILTDSGGIQEEAPSLGKPVLVLRERTERPEGVDAGTVILVGTDRERIVTESSRLLEDERVYEAMSAKTNPYGDGRAAERILEAILEWRRRGPGG